MYCILYIVYSYYFMYKSEVLKTRKRRISFTDRSLDTQNK